MMILYEEGKWLPTDPIAKYIPEFAQLKVFSGLDPDGKMILVDPEHPPTMRELMSHSAGFSYGNGNSPVDAMYKDLKPLKSANLQEMINKLAQIPLNYQPGKGWTYSLSMDIEGYLVEKLSGQSLPDFMRDRIFTPFHGVELRAPVLCRKGWRVKEQVGGKLSPGQFRQEFVRVILVSRRLPDDGVDLVSHLHGRDFTKVEVRRQSRCRR